MTKEEAKQSLVNTKVYVAGKSAEIQKKLFELGFSWLSEDNTVHLTEMPFIYIYINNFSSSQSMTVFSEHKNKEVIADYILNLTWEDNKPHHRPFESAEEVMEAIKEHGDWVKQSGYEHYDRICRVESGNLGTFDIGYISLKKAFEELTFIDGTPFGKLVED